MKKEPLIFIEHILENIKSIESFSEGISKAEFSKDKLRQNAIMRSIEIIGEATKNLPISFRNKYTNVPWKDIVGMRDKIIHHYFGVDLDIVWEVVKKDLPDLKEKIKKILEEVENEK